MADTRKIYWLTPGVLLTSLLLGILVSIGHHLFYNSLAGHEVPTGEYTIVGTSFSKQQFNLAIGTTFAFLAKSFLITAVSTAYFQAFWIVVKRRKGGTRLSVLDTTFSGLDSITALCKVTVWVRQPLLLILAIIAWYVWRKLLLINHLLFSSLIAKRSIPIAAIITPATLSIQNALFSPSSMTQVPNLDFTTFDFNSPLLVGGADSLNQTEYSYIGPSLQVSQVANGVFAQGQVLPISSPQSNASWTLQLWAPALQCANVSDEAKHAIGLSMLDYLLSANNSMCYLSPAYVAWVPPAGNFTPYATVNGSTALRSNESISFGNVWSLYVAVMPEMFLKMVQLPTHSMPLGCQDAVLTEDHNQNISVNMMIETFLGQDNSTVLECHAYNASYSLDFEFINGFQTVNVSINDSGDTLEAISQVTGPQSLSNGFNISSYYTGLAEQANHSCSTLNDKGQQCLFEPELLRKLSYQAIVEAFAENLIGYIGLAPSNGEDYVWSYNSKALDTVLMNTEELAFMQNWQLSGETEGDFADLAEFASNSNGSQYVGLSNNAVTKPTRGSLSQALESLFANYTVSLMSEDQLLPNYTSQYAPPPTTNVTYTAAHNVYYYSASTLWIAYGIAIGAATLAAFSGLSMILWKGETYDRKFSTVLRVGRANVLTEAIEMSEAKGAQPLSKKLAAARMIITEIGEKKAEEEEEEDARDGMGANDPDLQMDRRNLL